MKKIFNAYQLVGHLSTFFDRMMTNADLPARLALKFFWGLDEAAYQKFLVQAFAGVLQSIDRERAVDTLSVLRHVMRQLWPEVSGEAMRAPEELRANELEEEKRNFALIKAGVMPRMDTQGRWNYGARL